MANIDAAFGLRPYKMLGEGANTNGVSTYKIQTTGTAGTSSVIYEGTPVIPLANGLIDIAAQRNAYYRRQTNEQLAAVDNDLMRESNPTMPITKPERQSRVTFGGNRSSD